MRHKTISRSLFEPTHPTTPPKRSSPRGVLQENVEAMHVMFANFFSCRRLDCDYGGSSSSSPSLSFVDIDEDVMTTSRWAYPPAHANFHDVNYDRGESIHHRQHTYSSHYSASPLPPPLTYPAGKKEQRHYDGNILSSRNGTLRTDITIPTPKTRKKKRNKKKKLIHGPPRIQRLNLGSSSSPPSPSPASSRKTETTSMTPATSLRTNHSESDSNTNHHPVEIRHTRSLNFLFSRP